MRDRHLHLLQRGNQRVRVSRRTVPRQLGAYPVDAGGEHRIDLRPNAGDQPGRHSLPVEARPVLDRPGIVLGRPGDQAAQQQFPFEERRLQAHRLQCRASFFIVVSFVIGERRANRIEGGAMLERHAIATPLTVHHGIIGLKQDCLFQYLRIGDAGGNSLRPLEIVEPHPGDDKAFAPICFGVVEFFRRRQQYCGTR